MCPLGVFRTYDPGLTKERIHLPFMIASVQCIDAVRRNRVSRMVSGVAWAIRQTGVLTVGR